MKDPGAGFSGRRIGAGLAQTLRQSWAPILGLTVLFIPIYDVLRPGVAWVSDLLAGVGLAILAPTLGYLADLVVRAAYFSLLLCLVLYIRDQPLQRIIAAAARATPAVAFVNIVLAAPTFLYRLLQSGRDLTSFGYTFVPEVMGLAGTVHWLLLIAMFACLGLAMPVAVAEQASLRATLLRGWRLSEGMRWRMALTSFVLQVIAALPNLLLLVFPVTGYGIWVDALGWGNVVLANVLALLTVALSGEFYLEARRLRTGVAAESVDQVFG